ncbi:MAG: RepB family plasmid replication initiator protein [Lamprobacter sp.]|uniref:RepB family plasmid replication initiator protein n=1 Tax=Lamprobacter sp. TaxID=3100796 RepID=UPI002B2634F9|nr:RepB family plasmid replication initiator protein [Lamprobacter sp.]MEA3643461.1 RepB family plasmid replication initiator protein [Lamprobacter sp.]
MEEQPQVYKSNALVEASYRLSIYEQRIILAAISQVRRDTPLTDQHLYRVSAQEIAEMSGVKVDRAYGLMKEAAERLFERRVTLHKEPNGGPARTLVTRWVQAVEYIESEGSVGLQFAHRMLPYLAQLTEQFTHYALVDVAKMTSAYGIRLYELLIQWRGTGERVIELDWLRDALQLEGKYPDIQNLKRRVLEPAVDQINELSPLWVKWEQRKTGRRVTHIIFKFGEKSDSKPKKQKKLPIPQKKNAKLSLPRSYIEKHKQSGEDIESADQRLLFEIRTGKREAPK